jgi:hypothetical protein
MIIHVLCISLPIIFDPISKLPSDYPVDQATLLSGCHFAGKFSLLLIYYHHFSFHINHHQLFSVFRVAGGGQ